MKNSHLRRERFLGAGYRSSLALAACLWLGAGMLGLSVRGGALIDVPFDGDMWGTAENRGYSGGTGTWVQQSIYPDFSVNVPVGPYAPAGNVSSIDFGSIAAGDGARAIDFPPVTTAPTSGLRAFTIAGWINLQSTTIGSGGNRIISSFVGGNTGTLGSDRQRGFDLVQVANSTASATGARLRIGVNAAPDQDVQGPYSSNNKLTAVGDGSAPANNWVFFAVTYDARTDASNDGQVRYYFGNANTLAALDTGVGSSGVQTYDRGPIVDPGIGCTLGNFTSASGLATARNDTANSRVLRGLLDEIRFFDTALDLAAIQAVQQSSPSPLPPKISDVVPAPNTPFHPAAQGIQFTATSTAPIPAEGISVVLNGTDISSQLSVTGDPMARNVSWTGLEANRLYDASITVSNTMGVALFRTKFQTMLDSNYTFEAEDWNFDGGQYILNPVVSWVDPNSYVDRGGVLGVQGVDFNDLNSGTRPGTGSTEWRRPAGAGLPQTIRTADFMRQKYIDAMMDDYHVVNVLANEWLNYTRSFSAGNFKIYLRAQSSVAQRVQLDRVTGNITQPGQSTAFLGIFYLPAGNSDYQFVPLRDASGQFEVTAQLSGLQTLRLTPMNANNNVSLNYVMLVPATQVALPPAVSITAPADGTVSTGGAVTVSASASDSDGQVAKVKFTATLGSVSTVIGEITNAPYSLSWTPAADGTYTLVAEATDNAGMTALSSAIQVVVDTHPPAAVFVGSLDGQMVKIAFTEAVRQAAAETASNYQVTSHPGITVSQATLQPGGTAVELLLSAPITGQFQLAINNLQDMAGNAFPAAPITAYVSARRGAIIDLPFSEAAGTSTLNLGTSDGRGTFVQKTGFPAFSDNVPAGPYAPPANLASVDFNVIAVTNDGGRAIDFPAATTAPTTGLRAFTISGWINLRSTTIGSGGNRIIGCYPGGSAATLGSGRQRGFDIVQVANSSASPTGGRLRIGVNAAPDQDVQGPYSSDNAFTAAGDGTAPVDNWVFFAVTYDAKTDAMTDGEVRYYFGNGQSPAALDVGVGTDGVQIYDRGAIVDPGLGCTVGNFLTAVAARTDGANSRVLRGLMDDLKFFPYAMALSEIQTIQKAAPEAPPAVAISSPADGAGLRVGESATIAADVTDADSGIAQVEFTATSGAGSIALGTDTTAPYTVVWANLPAGTYSITAKATDTTGISTVSAPVTVYVDSTLPTVVSVASLDGASIRVWFDELVQPASATALPNYRVGDGTGVAVTAATLLPDGQSVRLDLSGAAPSAFNLSVTGVKDLAGNAITDVSVPGAVSLQGQALIELPFNENAGATTANLGIAGGEGTFVQQNGFPAFSVNLPEGDFAPPGNVASLDFGAIGSADGNRAVDFPSAVATATTGLRSFTVTGWINLRDNTIGPGGNRIITTWPNAAGGGTRSGFDLVVVADGRLRAGINTAPDYPDNTGPYSATSAIPISAEVPAANWTFFAFTYNDPTDGTGDGQVGYYFGNGSTPAALDSVGMQTYDRGAIVNAGDLLVVGNFTPPVAARTATGASSRVLRGLLDDVRFFPFALTLSEIQAAQKASSGVTAQPELAIKVENGQVIITWEGGGTLESADALPATEWTPVAGASSPYPVTPAGTKFYRVRIP